MDSRYQEDFEFVMSALEDGYIFLKAKEKEWGFQFREFKHKFTKRLPNITSDLEFWLLLKELVASLHDGHTGIDFEAIGATRPFTFVLPFEIRFINNKYYVSRWRKNVSPIKGMEIGDEVISIGGFSIGKLLEIFQCYQGYTMEETLKKVLAQSPQVVFNYFLPDYDFDSPVEVCLVSNDGKQKGVRIFWVSIPKEVANLSRTDILSYRWLRQDPQLAYLCMRNFFFPGTNNVRIIKDHLNSIFSEIWDSEGVVLDLRGNGGGTPTPFFEVISRLIQKPIPNFRRRWFISDTFLKYHEWSYRFTGTKGLTDWEFDGNPEKEIITPSSGQRLSKRVPIVIVVDWATISRAEQLPAMFREAGIATIFGERTAGADACPLQISLPNTGWRFSFSVGELRSAKGYNIEGKGVIPDIPFVADRADLGTEKDRCLAEAEQVLLDLI